MRLFALTLLAMWFLAPGAHATESECFGPDKGWCAWAFDVEHPEQGWRVAYSSQEEGTQVETAIQTVDNRPRLCIRLAPIQHENGGQVIISLRPDELHPEQWKQYVGRNSEFTGDALRFSLGRRALESVLQAPASATLYVFVEVRSPDGATKASHKVPLEGLNEALRFARLGR
ncbi:MAG: hypothetical protein GC201_12775 [Alphaproteobacteria bacterium]|nr:hypothetical protein [Alphaproteobacteria bacterium]